MYVEGDICIYTYILCAHTRKDYLYTYIHIYIHTHIHTYIYIHIHIHRHRHRHRDRHRHRHRHIHIYIYIYVYIYTYETVATMPLCQPFGDRSLVSTSRGICSQGWFPGCRLQDFGPQGTSSQSNLELVVSDAALHY